MQLLLFGAPGVGKGTQAKLLSSKLTIPHISTGDILRQAVKEQTEVGKKAQEIMNKGNLVPDDIMIDIIRERLVKEDCKHGFILDGFPRTEKQAIELNHLLSELNKNDIILVNILADENEIIKRLNNRRACKVCGEIFTLKEIDGITKCPNCKAEKSFYLREDDKENVIKKRLEVFRLETEPVLGYYQSMKKKIISVNGLGAVDKVNDQLLKFLNS